MFDRAKFEQWMQKVNNELTRLCGMASDDLPDCCYADWYEKKVTPMAAAKRAKRNALG